MTDYVDIPQRWPENATFELTVRCNLHCRMCLFRHDDRENADMALKELTAGQWISMAEQAAAMGTVGLLITGGEPMLRSDFEEIYEGIYRQGFILELYTNATLVTPRIMALLRRCPPHKIGISIYGASPETYEKVCGNAGAFERMLQGVRELMTLPSVLDFRTTVIRDNWPDVDAMQELIRREFGAEYQLTQTRMVMKAVRGGCADVENCRLSPEDNVRLAYKQSFDRLKAIVGESFDEKNVRLTLKKAADQEPCQSRERYSILGCSGGMTSYAVTWDGRLQACQALGAFWTDAAALGLEKAWAQFPCSVKMPSLDEKCQNCKISDLCQCCPASRYAETGSPGGCPEYACRDADITNTLITGKGGMNHD